MKLSRNEKKEKERIEVAKKSGEDIYEIDTIGYGEFKDTTFHYSLPDVLSQLESIQDMTVYEITEVRKNGEVANYLIGMA